MQLPQLPIKPNAFALLALVGFVVGCSIPSFYEWSGSNQSRSPPIVWQTALGLLAVTLAICIALPWLPSAADPPAPHPRGAFRFRIRTILVFTTGAAVLAAAFRATALPLLGIVSYVIALAFALHSWIAFRRFRGRLLSLLACMYLPYVWVLGVEALRQNVEMLWLTVGLPSLVPSLLISSLAEQHLDQTPWLGVILTSLELIGGVWLIRLGRRWAIVYHLLALLLSTFGSFALNALIRM